MVNEELLGPAEKHVVVELKDSVKSCIEEAQKLVNMLNEIDLDNLPEMMLDPEKKELVISFIEPTQKLKGNLGVSQLMPLIMKAVLNPK